MQPARSLPLSVSQNSLRRRRLVDDLLNRSSIQPGDLVLDLGAGPGLLTDCLVRRRCRVWAVERDPRLVARLRVRFADHPQVRIIGADILRLPLPSEPYKVFSNIPFAATAAIVRHLCGAINPPTDAYLVVQREAAERFVGWPRPGLAAVLLFPWFEASIVHAFKRTDFAPVPQVSSVLLRLRKRGPPLVPPAQRQLFRDLVVRLFTAPQPSVSAALAQVVGHRRARRLGEACGLDRGARPTSLRLDQWLRLFGHLECGAPAATRWLVAGAERGLATQQRHLQRPTRTRAPRQQLPRPPRTGAPRQPLQRPPGTGAPSQPLERPLRTGAPHQHLGAIGDCRPPPCRARLPGWQRCSPPRQCLGNADGSFRLAPGGGEAGERSEPGEGQRCSSPRQCPSSVGSPYRLAPAGRGRRAAPGEGRALEGAR